LRIVTLGDVLLDVVVLLSEPLAAGGDVRASNRTGAGGQAANVARGRSSSEPTRGASRSGGNDPAGELVARELGARGVEVVGPVGEGDTGVVVSIVDAGDRSLASDRGVAPTFAPEELDAAWLACDVLHLSGYALLREPIAATALLAARLARERGARVSVDVAAWTEIRNYGPVQFRELLDELAPDVLFATEAEWELLGGAYLTAPVGVLKRGARGCTVFTTEAKLDFVAIDAEVVDPTGAGDALAAGLPRWRFARRSSAARARGGGPLRRESRVAAVRVEAWNGTYASEVGTWHYEPPYDFYDLASDPHDAAEMRNPAHAAHYRAVLAKGGDLLDAFWYFNRQRDVVDVGSGSDQS
jgi:sugar/nucleoside kinase (ribokinase family)